MDRNSWFGLAADGSKRSISHKDLMEWANRKDMQFQVGWSDHITMPDGTRLVRGKTTTGLVDTAREQEWHDIADLVVKCWGTLL